MRGMSGHESPNKGATDDWWTPIELVRSLGKFDLDPCGNKKHPTADLIYEENGLGMAWHGRVWMNPPYSQNEKWVDKFIEHRNGVALLFARTETKWCQKLLNSCEYVYFLNRRISFLKHGKPTNGNSGAPSALFYFGDYVRPSMGGVLMYRKIISYP
jgi:hypothetical protein